MDIRKVWTLNTNVFQPAINTFKRTISYVWAAIGQSQLWVCKGTFEDLC